MKMIKLYWKYTICLFATLVLARNLTYSQNNKAFVPEQSKILIRQNDTLITLINIIKAEPKNYPDLLYLLKEGTDKLFSKQKGFVGVAIHCNNERNTIVLYGQWQSKSDIENFRKEREIKKYFNIISALGTFESTILEEIPYLNSIQK